MTAGGADREVHVLREEIDQTRAELAETVRELAARVDVPARARAAWANRSEPVRSSARRIRQSRLAWLVVAGVGAATLVVVGLVARGRRR